jgi:putative transposase
MIDPNHPELSIQAQCDLIALPRSTYYDNRNVSQKVETVLADPDEPLMQLVDEIFTELPFYGSRKMVHEIMTRTGWIVNRKRVCRIMRKLGLEAIVPWKDTSKPHTEHKKYPYLLRGVRICRVDQVWSTDITYIQTRNGYCYLAAIVDWFSRKVLAWRMSNTLDSSFCVDALEEAIMLLGEPEIFNTDQGSQFTSDAFTGVLKAHGIRISMDGKGRALDNVFVERLWRSLKYENVYIKGYETMKDAQAEISEYMEFFNGKRIHQNLGYKTPDHVYPQNHEERKSA